MSYYVDHMEQLKMASMREKHPNWIWNRSDAHIFLAVPEQHDAFTTVVEPGNSFSPGPCTYGVSSWVKLQGKLHAPENMSQADMNWSFEEGRYPISCCGWNTGQLRVETFLFPYKVPGTIDFHNYFRVTISNPFPEEIRGKFYLAIRSFGAAGGPIHSLRGEGNVVGINGAPLVYAATAGKFSAVSYETRQTDISEVLSQEEEDLASFVEDASGWASGALEYTLDLKQGESVSFDFAFHLHAGVKLFTWLKPLDALFDWDVRKREVKDMWDQTIRLNIHVPDKRFHDSFFAQIAHLYMASGQDAPHISPISYPTWWARDSAYILVALAKAGLEDFARRCAAHAGRFQVSCCFGTEGDIPGERIWMISEHYLLTRDIAFLREHYGYIQENAEKIVEMRHSKVPLAYFNELFNHQRCISPEITYACAPSEDGLVMGRMDFMYPVFYVNSFCYLGLKRAAMCAEALGHGADAARYGKERDELRAAMKKKARESFGQNERDTATAYAPSGWADTSDDFLIQAYEDYWNTKWCPNGIQTHEPLWTYFEIGDAKNRVFLGERERAWNILDYYLDNHTCAGLYSYHEGDKDENSVTLAWEKVRGWDKARFVTPHGWSGAEMLSLLRECLVREDEEGHIMLGSGVPLHWEAHDFSIENFPTYYGKISYQYKAENKHVYATITKTHPCEVILDLPFLADLTVADR